MPAIRIQDCIHTRGRYGRYKDPGLYPYVVAMPAIMLLFVILWCSVVIDFLVDIFAVVI